MLIYISEHARRTGSSNAPTQSGRMGHLATSGSREPHLGIGADQGGAYYSTTSRYRSTTGSGPPSPRALEKAVRVYRRNAARARGRERLLAREHRGTVAWGSVFGLRNSPSRGRALPTRTQVRTRSSYPPRSQRLRRANRRGAA